MSGPKLDLTPCTIPRLNLRQQMLLGLSVKRSVDTHKRLVEVIRSYVGAGRTAEAEVHMRKLDEETAHIVLGFTAIILSRLRNSERLNFPNT